MKRIRRKGRKQRKDSYRTEEKNGGVKKRGRTEKGIRGRNGK